MDAEQFAIQNDIGFFIKGVIERPKPRGKFPLVVLAGDFFDTAESPNVKEARRLLLDAGCAVVRFDFTNSYGQSDGRGADITISQRARDLEDVVEYAKRRGYIHVDKVSALGFGFGALAALVLQSFKSPFASLVLINIPASVQGSVWTRFDDRDMMRIKLKRYFHVPLAGQEVRINYTFFEDGLRLDMPRVARNLKDPVCFVVGESDEIIPPAETQWWLDRIPCEKNCIKLDVDHVSGRAGVKAVVDSALDFFKAQKAI